LFQKVKSCSAGRGGFFSGRRPLGEAANNPGAKSKSEAAMAIETLGEARSQGWRVTVRCAYGRSESPRSQSSRECSYRKELDMETLVWTRGRAFPLSRLESRLRCPRCGSRYVVVLYEPPRRAAAR
jgi:hypothetical protein